MRLHAIIAVVLVSGCATFPELDARLDDATRSAPFPELVPLEGLTGPAPRLTDETGSALAERAAALAERAEALRRPVISAPLQQSLTEGVDLSELQ